MNDSRISIKKIVDAILDSEKKTTFLNGKLMMFYPAGAVKVLLVLGTTDLRKAVNSLSIQEAEGFDLDPFSGQLFVFCNGRHNILKILHYDHNGFCLWYNDLKKWWLLQGLALQMTCLPCGMRWNP